MKMQNRNLLGSSLILAISMLAIFELKSHAAEQAKGGPKLQQMNRVATLGDIEALKAGDTFAMACAKCQTISVKEVVSTAKGAEVLAADGKPTKVLGKHLCEGCGSTIEVVGHGKGKESKITHTCAACGETSVFCCATKPGSGATKGMEKAKH